MGDRFVLRPLGPQDFQKGYMQLLGQLTVTGDVTEEVFKSGKESGKSTISHDTETERVEYLEQLGDDHHVAVIEDVEKGQIVATGSVLIEHKFVRNCGKAGHIEDVVVDHTVRGQRLGQRIIDYLTNFAKERCCYKVILDCTTENAAFYEKCGFHKKEIQMAKYF